MTEFDNSNRGSLFKNNDRKSDKHPEYSGSINVGGVEYWLSGWVKQSKNGNQFFSLAVKPKEAREEQAAPTKRIEDLDSEIPF